jgi:hypothetical protein
MMLRPGAGFVPSFHVAMHEEVIEGAEHEHRPAEPERDRVHLTFH